MLFDLRGRGRRTTVRAIYLGLAILIGVGLIGFGIGGGALSGGLFNSLSSGGSSTGANSFSSEITNAQKLTKREPNNPAAWAALVRALFQQAGAGANYDSTTGEFTAAATPVLHQAAAAWQRYLALDPDSANTALANEMFQVYEGQGALNDPASAVQVLQILVAHQAASATLYEQLAVYAYEAGNNGVGELAANKALALTPKAQRSQMEQIFASAKAQAASSSVSSLTASATAAPASTATANVSTVSVSTAGTVPASTSTVGSAVYQTAPASTATASTKAPKR